MKRMLLVFLAVASLGLSFGNAFAAMQFGITTGEIKLGDVNCSTWSLGMHSLIVDGPYVDGTTNVYSVRTTPGLFGTQNVMMDKSNDGGLTWLQSTGIAGGGSIGCDPAIVINPVAESQSLHFVWDAGSDIYYGNGSITTRVNGSVPYSGGGSIGIAVDKTVSDAVIHILFSAASGGTIYYTSSSNGLTFSEPESTGASSQSAYSFIADSDGNLYLAYDRGKKFKKKPAGELWGSEITVSADMNGHPSIAVYEPNTILIAAYNRIAKSDDRGSTWDTPTLLQFGSSDVSLAVSADGKLNYAFEGAEGIYFARTTRSLDPTSFGQPVLALSGTPSAPQHPNLAVDSAGKAYIMADHDGVAVFTREK